MKSECYWTYLPLCVHYFVKPLGDALQMPVVLTVWQEHLVQETTITEVRDHHANPTVGLL